MDPVTVSVTIAKPREEVFGYLADIANHAEFCDHFLKDWHLTREQSYGRGAGARFRVEAPATRFPWADTTLTEVQSPYRIVSEGRGGKFNRIRLRTTFTVNPAPGDMTRVEMSTETEPAMPSDRLLEALAGRGWVKRKTQRALRRLRSILEEGEERGRRATLAGV